MSLVAKQRPTLERKKNLVQDLIKLINKYNIIGLMRMENIGLKQLQNIKKKLKGLATIKMAKNSVIKLALVNSGKPGLEKLAEHIKGPTAIILSEINGFKLMQFIKENKSKAYAKPGMKADTDIIIPAGNTGFQPGPMITELNDMGLKTKIVSGTIWIAQDTLVVRAGEEISRKIALLLTRLNIQPVSVGLDLTAVFENGLIFAKTDLDINVEEIKNQLQQAYTYAYNLSFNIAYPMKENIYQLISKAYTEAYNLSRNAKIILPETVGEILLSAQNEADTLYNIVRERNPNI
ncbi:MAG: 50S ribosomal protein L10 [Candidatus Odinarchaeota archaeon]